MKKKYLKFFIFFLFVSLLFSQSNENTKEQDKTQKEEKEEYVESFKKNQSLLNNSLEKDFQQKIKVALELESINPDLSIQRYIELIYLYPDLFKKSPYQDKILDALLDLYLKYKDIETYFLFIEELKQHQIIDEEMENKIKQKYFSKF
jgi:hypothetical protein